MAENKELKYNEPWILQRADPFVCKKDGWYYFTASIPSYDCIALRRSKTLDGLKDAEEVVVWKKHESGIYGLRSFIIFSESGISILRQEKQKIFGIFVHMCLSVRVMIL